MSTDTERVLFTSESVTNGHPDKLCDAISDAILDACITQDPRARVACETLVKGTDKDSVIILAGEITVAGETPDYAGVARATAASIGYTSQDVGMDAATCDVEVRITTQSPDISGGVSQGNVEQGAGDQGMMFGYATNESEGYDSLKGTYMPLSALLSQTLTRRLTEVREQGILPWARPDGKSQVTIEYSDDGKPVRILTVVIALQHDDLSEELGSREAMLDYIKDEVKQHVVDPVIPSELVDSDTNVIVNGAGPFIRGGPYADAGLTGRKIIVDTYGGMGRHGGGAFSGKDPSKVDRSAAYAARWAAKHVIAAGLADECEIQLAYAIGVAEPVSVRVTTNGTTADGITEEEISRRIRSAFDFRPWEIIRQLDLLRPIYTETSSGGHFGRESVGETFPWERLEEARLSALRQE
ncbi:MAG: methionine adenosyltransferase [Candidatus Thermoplasmatota archaeon]|nr:methionine adenosyltransferase [Candidatus Thermoplasmatota archaeon]MEE3083558.1 methionine adenosyltransferase [Candidatus Thermoplasmatota archaeon]